MMSDVLFNQELEEIRVYETNVQEMETFLLRNHIPYSTEAGAQGEVVFLVRAGFDCRDAMIFSLKMWGDLKNPEVAN